MTKCPNCQSIVCFECGNCECKESKWTKCSDQIPPLGMKNRLLFVNGKGEVTYGYAYEDWEQEENGSVWINDMDRETNEVATYWMQLPELPKEV